MEYFLFTYLPRLHPRLHLAALVVPCVVIVAALSLGLVAPDWREVKRLRASRAILAEVLDSGEAIASELEATRQSVARLENRVYGKNMNLPMKQLEAQIIGRLQEISSRNRVQLDGVRPGSKKRLRLFVESPIEVEVNGDYFDIARWLRELSGELGFIVVKEYEMLPLTRDAIPPVRMKITLVSYRMAEV
ncbi:MAG: type 4a pilus biogenesis protein PilO [Nitrospirota bacterium]|jgi:Tfp pilus assembly protein PilO